MKKLSKLGFLSVEKHMYNEARPLEESLFEYSFGEGTEDAVLDALSAHQNEDGGFGKGLESDFWMKESSPMATSLGLSVLTEFEHTSRGKDMIKKAVQYLEESFNVDRRGWFAVSREVNDAPHAPWWNFDEENGVCPIDQAWGNPTAELLGYLLRYEEYVSALNLPVLVENAITHFLSESTLESEHEIYCYIKLYHQLGKKEQQRLYEKIVEAVGKLMNPDVDQWTNYVPMPLNFVEAGSKELFGISVNDINENLNYYVEILNDKGHIEPVWTWADYPNEWIEAKREWTGVLTLSIMEKLKAFDRVDF